MDFSAQSLYGGTAPIQPVPADHIMAGAPSGAAGPHFTRTEPLPRGPLGNPTFALVALLGLAALLIQFSVRVGFEVRG